MLKFANLASGSSGNATLIEARNGSHISRLLVDCGLRLRELDQRLRQLNTCLAELDAIFITHEHSDHVGHAKTILQYCDAKLILSHGTWLAIEAADWALPKTRVVRTHDGQEVSLGSLTIRPFTVPHDAREPLQLRCTDGTAHLGLATDLGHVSDHVVSSLSGLHALILEANHDLDLLNQSAYPAFLKARISGRLGHLSNNHAADLLAKVLHPGLRLVVAAHLSERNNTPELALQALQTHQQNTGFELRVASAHQATDWTEVVAA